MSFSHKGLENTPYERKESDIRRVFFIKQNKKIIDERISPHGLQQIDIADDGNCLFRSVSLQLYGLQDRHLDIRAKVKAFMESDKESLLQFFDSMDKLEQYIDKMSREARWGDDLTLRCVAEKFQVEIHVLTNEVENFYKHFKPTFSQETKDVSHRHLFLSHVPPMHYQPICTDKTFHRLRSVKDLA